MNPRPIVAPQMLFKYGDGTISEYVTKWCYAGPSHHMTGAYGRLTHSLRKVASMMGIEIVVI